MKNFLLLLLSLTALTCFAQVKHTVTKSSVTYEIKNMGIKTNGSFGGLQADINFDPEHLATSTIEASVDVNTLNSDNTMRDNHLKSEEYFNPAHYPRIIFKSVSFKHKSGNNYTGIFNVTLKGKTKAIEVPFTYTDNSSSAEFKGSFKLNRLDFEVGGKSIVLSDEAVVLVDVTTNK